MKISFPLIPILVSACSTNTVVPPVPVLPLPSESQLAWHAMEMNAFVHFTTNTFTGKEWGFGDESPAIFNPSAFDAEQWVRTFSETGFRGVILTCKHHDGFCLWPSKYTGHSVKNAPWQNGNGDVVKAVADACRKYGLKFGVYVSPWDRNHSSYATPGYLSYYRDQLTELFTRYGPIFEMWFDGANGGDGYYGGAREKRTISGSTYYKWSTTLDLVRGLEPSVIFFSDAGPGVRWAGNEKGLAGETNWCTLTPDKLYAGKPGIEKLLNVGAENGTQWIPAEVDVSIRPGWFYHPEEDSLVKSPEQLFDIYLTSIGRGSTLLLNVPPDQRGLLHEKDVASLRGFRELLDKEFRIDYARKATVAADNVRGNSFNYAATQVIDRDPSTYWATNDPVRTGYIDMQWNEVIEIKYVVIQEHIALGQRVRSFTIEAWKEGVWKSIAQGTTIGYKRIIKLGSTKTNKLRINITDSKACPLLQSVEVY